MNILDEHVLVMGYGAVAHCLVPALKKYRNLNLKKLFVVDQKIEKADKEFFIREGIGFAEHLIVKDNFLAIFERYATPGGIILDLTVNLDTYSILQLCLEKNFRYINAAVEEWDPFLNAENRTPQSRTLYYRQSLIQSMKKGKGNPTIILDQGANPGIVSHLAKKGIHDLASFTLEKNPQLHELRDLIAQKNFPKIAEFLNIKVMHIAERDSQIPKIPRKPGQFLNTWSAHGLFEEGVAPSEMGWGTHEPRLPERAYTHPEGTQHQICLAQIGFKTRIRSWVPSGPILGMVIRHGESFTLSKYLTTRKNDGSLYRPTVHYVYRPCDTALASIWELESYGFDLSKMSEIRVYNGDEIEQGNDEIGVLLMGDFGAWWTGMNLSHEEAQTIVPGQNATVHQVVGGLISSFDHAVANPKDGILYPEDLDHEFILERASRFLGEITSFQCDWTPLKDRTDRNIFGNYDSRMPFDMTEIYSFNNFLSY